jgi:hypothetical protein
MSANPGQDTQLVLNKARPACRELTIPPSTIHLHAASFDVPFNWVGAISTASCRLPSVECSNSKLQLRRQFVKHSGQEPARYKAAKRNVRKPRTVWAQSVISKWTGFSRIAAAVLLPRRLLGLLQRLL